MNQSMMKTASTLRLHEVGVFTEHVKFETEFFLEYAALMDSCQRPKTILFLTPPPWPLNFPITTIILCCWKQLTITRSASWCLDRGSVCKVKINTTKAISKHPVLLLFHSFPSNRLTRILRKHEWEKKLQTAYQLQYEPFNVFVFTKKINYRLSTP